MANESSVKKAIKLVLRYALGASFALQALLLMDGYMEGFVLADMSTFALWASIFSGAVPFVWLLKPVFSSRLALAFFLIGVHIASFAAAISADVIMILIFPTGLGVAALIAATAFSKLVRFVDNMEPVEPVAPRRVHCFESHHVDRTNRKQRRDTRRDLFAGLDGPEMGPGKSVGSYAVYYPHDRY